MTSQPPAEPPRRVWAWAGGVFVALFAVYLQGVIPTVVDQDSGELVSACHVLGIAHPTGYPLWVVLGRLFDFLPVGHTSAFRVALLSAVCAAAAGAVIALLAARLAGQASVGALAGLALGLWHPVWSQAVRAEVYGLTALLSALAIGAFLKWARERSWRSGYLLALACGAVAMHHRTAMLAVAPALLMAAVMVRPRRARRYLAAAAVFLLPFVCYAYLPIRAAQHPPLNWTNPSTWDRFLDHVLASQYAHFALHHTAAQMMEQGVKLLPQVLSASIWLSLALALIGLPFIAWGWVVWYRRQPLVGGALAGGAALLVFWVLQWGETSDLKVFLSPLGQVMALCCAVGLARMAELPGGWQWLRVQMAPKTAFALCLLLAWANWARSDLSDQWGYRDEWAAALMQMEPNAIFVSDFDVPSFATIYLVNVEGLRKDVILLRTVGVAQEWYLDLIADPELRRAARESWQQASEAFHYPSSGTPEFMDASALFSAMLAEHYRGRRPVYALHGARLVRLPEPPYFVGLSEDLVRVQFDSPHLQQLRLAGQPLAQFPGAPALMGFQWERDEAGNGQMVPFTSTWRLEGQTRGLQFGVALVPGETSLEEFAALPEEAVRERTRLVQAFPMAYGLGAAADREGMVYSQAGSAIIPSNAPAGRYRTAIALAPMYSMAYGGWTEVGEIEVKARPLPRNGP